MKSVFTTIRIEVSNSSLSQTWHSCINSTPRALSVENIWCYTIAKYKIQSELYKIRFIWKWILEQLWWFRIKVAHAHQFSYISALLEAYLFRDGWTTGIFMTSGRRCLYSCVFLVFWIMWQDSQVFQVIQVCDVGYGINPNLKETFFPGSKGVRTWNWPFSPFWCQD
jgi:hypothetical protein